MIEPDNTTALIVKLNRLTSLDKISWKHEVPPKSLTEGTDDVINIYMVADYKGTKFGLYNVRYKAYDGNNEQLFASERLVLAILDAQRRSLWEMTNNHSALNDLFQTARRKSARVDEIIAKVIFDGED